MTGPGDTAETERGHTDAGQPQTGQTDTAHIEGWHAHLYYDETTFEQAAALREEAGQRFAVELGRLHRKPVGPHPRWSCQLAFGPEIFTEIVPWLALNRGDLVVFIHPETGQPLEDHRDRAIWLGTGLDLNLAPLEAIEPKR